MKSSSDAEPPFLLEDLREITALDVAHRDVERAAIVAGVVDWDDVRVVEAGCDMRLLQKTVTKAPVSLDQSRGKDLECDLPPEACLFREIHDAHPAAPEHGFDPETGYFGSDSGT